MWSFEFFANNAMLGVGLAMDAFSVSAVSGLTEPAMRKRRMLLIAGTFGLFQFLMPLLGWALVSFAEQLFSAIRPFIPWAAFVLLLALGIKMIVEGCRTMEEEPAPMGFGALLLQGIATSIDALSAGLTMADYRLMESLAASALIGAITFAICIAGIFLGRKFGKMLKNRALIVGGAILIVIGIKILVEALIKG